MERAAFRPQNFDDAGLEQVIPVKFRKAKPA